MHWFLRSVVFPFCCLCFLTGEGGAAASGPVVHPRPSSTTDAAKVVVTSPFVVVLGIAQDAGYPQMGCQKDCCAVAWKQPQRRRMVSCLAIADLVHSDRWLIDATPDIIDQLHLLDGIAPPKASAGASDPGLNGIFLTHAHIGHYTGLMELGREAMGSRDVIVHALPRMARFLRTNGPWSQLVRLHNIRIEGLEPGRAVDLGPDLRVTAFLVPHRDEFSETAGYRIDGPHRSVLFIPDIDKWARWEQSLSVVLASVDRAYLDGSFFANGEIEGRDMSEIPHPFIEETLKLLADLPIEERAKVRFIHLNHTNPALDPDGTARLQVQRAGCEVAEQGERFSL